MAECKTDAQYLLNKKLTKVPTMTNIIMKNQEVIPKLTNRCVD